MIVINNFNILIIIITFVSIVFLHIYFRWQWRWYADGDESPTRLVGWFPSASLRLPSTTTDAAAAAELSCLWSIFVNYGHLVVGHHHHYHHRRHLLLRPDRRAEYCDDRVCVSVCLFASISPELHVWSPPNFCARYLWLPIPRSSSGSVAVAICCVLPFRLMTSCLHIMSRCTLRKERALKVTLQVALEAAAGWSLQSTTASLLGCMHHIQNMRMRPIVTDIASSVCVCWTQPRAQRKQPNRLRCRLGHGIGTKEPCIRWRTDPLGEKTILSGIFWPIVNYREYTPVSQKTRHQTLANNFTKYEPIFKLFSLMDSVVNLQQTHV